MVERHLSLVAKTQYCVVLVSRGGWCQVTVCFHLLPLQRPPLPCGGRARRWRGANVLPSSCVMQFVSLIRCGICSDARNVGFPRYNRSRYDWFDTIHPVSVAIRYRSDNCPFSILHVIKIWTYKNRTGTAVFIKTPTANWKMETVTAL